MNLDLLPDEVISGMIAENFQPTQVVDDNGRAMLRSPETKLIFKWFEVNMKAGHLEKYQKDRIYDAIDGAMERWTGL